jgi:hypothetical protein
LYSKELISVLVEGVSNVPTKYSSNEKWIYWLYGGDSNGIYIYDIENNKTYLMHGKGEYNIYSTHLQNNTLYVNAKFKDISSVIYEVSLDTMEIIGYTSIKGDLDKYTSHFESTLDGKVHVFSGGQYDRRTYITNFE